MAEQKIDQKIGDWIVGEIIFDETPPSLDITRTPAGVNFKIPAAVWLRWNDRKRPCPVLKSLRAVIYSANQLGAGIELGWVRDDSVYFGVTSTERAADKADLLWTNFLPSLFYIEEHRGTEPPKLRIEVRCELYYMIKAAIVPPRDVIYTETVGYDVLSFPHKSYGTAHVTYPKDVWERMVQAAL
jgi:hypothetical protein